LYSEVQFKNGIVFPRPEPAQDCLSRIDAK